MKFKEGDKVRVKEDSPYLGVGGKEGVVVEILSSPFAPYEVKVGKGCLQFRARELDLVERRITDESTTK